MAARSLGIAIPTLCFVEGFEHSASCFLCAVKLEGRPNLWPSCATPVAEGMKVITGSEEVRDARKTSLELLLSDHAGDCVGPCRTGCPAGLDIPNFIARISAGDHRKSAEIVTDDLTLPASLGRVCPRLCEERCRQCEVEESLSIRNLHRFAADTGRSVSPVPQPSGAVKPQGAGGTPALLCKRVAIVGAGPAGLAAAPLGARAVGANDRIRMGFIGVGNRGSQLMDVFRLFPEVEVAALCVEPDAAQ